MAAAVAANLALAGLASETGKSIRGPSAYTGLVGLRSTIGLVSTRGVAPMRPSTVGPMTRTVADMAAVLTVLAGVDPEDPGTVGTRPAGGDLGYSEALGSSDLKESASPSSGRGTGFRPDAQVLAVFERALDDLRKLGAILIDSLPIDTVLRMLVRPAPATGLAAPSLLDLQIRSRRMARWVRTGEDATLRGGSGGRTVTLEGRSLFEQAALVEVRPDANPDCARPGMETACAPTFFGSWTAPQSKQWCTRPG